MYTYKESLNTSPSSKQSSTEEYTGYTHTCAKWSSYKASCAVTYPGSTEFYPEFSRRAGPAPKISLQLYPSQDCPYKMKTALQTDEMATRDDDTTLVI